MKVCKTASRACLIVLLTLTSLSGCGFFAARTLQGEVAQAPADFTFVGDKAACYLELKQQTKALRMNCFHLDGVLHIHSSRWANLPRFSGESWTVTVVREPQVRIELDGKIYNMTARYLDDEARRQEILYNRGYWYAWDAIKVFAFLPS